MLFNRREVLVGTAAVTAAAGLAAVLPGTIHAAIPPEPLADALSTHAVLRGFGGEPAMLLSKDTVLAWSWENDGIHLSLAWEGPVAQAVTRQKNRQNEATFRPDYNFSVSLFDAVRSGRWYSCIDCILVEASFNFDAIPVEGGFRAGSPKTVDLLINGRPIGETDGPLGIDTQIADRRTLENLA